MRLQHLFFENTAKKYPNFIAVDDHGKKITYRKLDLLANKVANLLSENGCSNNDRVCILTKKNIWVKRPGTGKLGEAERLPLIPTLHICR